MKVKELFEAIHPLCDPEFVVYDLSADKESKYSWVNWPNYKQEFLSNFGERVIQPQSVVFGEDNCEELFIHLVVE